MPTCQVCGSAKFTVDAGFSYCDDCGTRSQFFQELEYETYFEGIDNRLAKSAIKVVAEHKGELQLTSWEEYNYILIGLVNELINLGAKEELKLVALQLWTAYLRANEAAFFSRKKIKIPKLSASFKMKDAEIIYNLKKERRKRVRSKKTNSAGTGSQAFSNAGEERRQFRRTQRSLMRSEYEAYQTELETNTSMSVLNRSSDGGTSSGRSSATSASSAPITIEFSRLSRRILKKTMPKKHLQKHEADGLLKCHAFTRKNYARDYHPEIVSRNTMFELLYLALNQIGDPLQLGDMLRFIKEGHLTFTNILKFFPAELRPEQKVRLLRSFNSSGITCPSHAFVRFGARQLVGLLGVRMRPPNMVALTARYVAELGLPSAVHKVIETLLTICPPQMRLVARGKQHMPHYEGRAVAFVLFAMKLLFGLDDEREVRMSEAAERVNQRLRGLPGAERQRPLFVWTEWMRYVEMRNVILAQCHYATASAQNPNGTAENAHLYAEFLRTYNKQAEFAEDDKPDSHRKNDRTSMANMGIIFGKAKQMHEKRRRGDEEEAEEGCGNRSTAFRGASLKFQPTLQPKSAYLERLIEDAVMAATVYIPSFMYVDHTGRDVVPFLRPSELRRRLPAGQRLRVHRLSGIERFYIRRPFKETWPAEHMPFTNAISLRSYDFDIDTVDWLEGVRAKDEADKRLTAQKGVNLLDSVKANVAIMKSDLEDHRARARNARVPRDVAREGENELNESMEMFTQPLEEDTIPAGQPVESQSARGVSVDSLANVEGDVSRPEAEDEEEAIPISQPDEAESLRRVSVDNMSHDNQSVDNQSVDNLLVDSQPVDSQPVENLLVDSQPVDNLPADSPPVDIPPFIEDVVSPAGDERPATRALSPRRDPEERVPLFEMILSEDEDSDDDDDDVEDNEDAHDNTDPPLDFFVNDFDYWMCTGRLEEMKHSVFKEMCSRTMPQNFVWLMRQCAQLVECYERDVYRELQIIENFYAYRLAPFERMNHMLLYRAARRQMHIPELTHTILRLSAFW